MKRISILITEPDEGYANDVMEDVEDDINSVLHKYFSGWDFAIVVQND